MITRETIVRCARNAASLALLIIAGMIIMFLLRSLLDGRFRSSLRIWLLVCKMSAVSFGIVFAVFFIWNIISAKRSQLLWDALEVETSESELLAVPLFGFVAMEFYWLILNRTYVVFVAREGLYGWKASGPVTNSDRRYFVPFQEMVEDQELMKDMPAIRNLAGLRGGFFYAASTLLSVASDSKSQWGMGGIEHSGHVKVRLSLGKTHNFILLGSVLPEDVRDRITKTLGVGITSV